MNRTIAPRTSTRQQRDSDYSAETEQRIESLLDELYGLLQIRRPNDLFGSIVIEARYQNGRPVGHVDVNIRYVMKRTTAAGNGRGGTER